MKNTKWFGIVKEGEPINKAFFYDTNEFWNMVGFHTEKLGYNIIIMFGMVQGKWPFMDIFIDSMKLEKVQDDLRKVRDELWDFKKKNREARDELKRLVSLLSGNTYQEGDNMMEAIEAFQERKYMKEHKEDFLMIMTQNAPEVAAQELFEYFELEVPDSTNIEIETAKKLYDIWMRATNQARYNVGKAEVKIQSWESLTNTAKQFYIQEVYKLWNK